MAILRNMVDMIGKLRAKIGFHTQNGKEETQLIIIEIISHCFHKSLTSC